MKTRIAVLLAAVVAVALLLAMKSAKEPQNREAHTSVAYYITQKGSYSPYAPIGTYTWANGPISLRELAKTVIVRPYAGCGLVSNGVPAQELPECMSSEVQEVEIDTTGLDGLWFDPFVGLIGRTAKCVSTVTCVAPQSRATRYHGPGAAIGAGEAFIFPAPMNCHSTAYIGCTAVVLYDGHTLVYAHAMGEKGFPPDNPNVPQINAVNLFTRLDAHLSFASGNWRCWVAAGCQQYLDAILAGCAARNVKVELQQVIGASGHSVYWTQRTETFSIIPD